MGLVNLSRSVEGYVAFVTGAASGMGEATAKLFASEGAKVAAVDLNEEGLQRVVSEIEAAGCQARGWALDLGDREAITRVIDEAAGHFGGLDMLVNNAGISPKSAEGQRLDTVSGDLALWQQVYQVNAFAPLMLAKSLLDCLETGSGTVVNVTSIAGSRVHEFAGSAYATSKAALSALTREMASDFGKLGVRVNAIAPGEIKTDILSPDSEAAILPQIPMRRFGTADEVAETIFFLCSDQANYVNGAEIHVNGGQHV